MPVEWVVGGLVSIVTSLAGAVAWLAKRHIERLEREIADWKAIAQAGSADLDKLVPGVTSLSSAVEAEHRVAQDFRGSIDRKVDEVHGDIRELLGRRGR